MRTLTSCPTVLIVALLTRCQAYVDCGPGAYAVRGDGSGRWVEQDGSGRWVDQDGNVLTKRRGGVLCHTVTPPTVCGPGTLRVDSPWGMAIAPDGSGWFVDQDGSGRWVEQDKDELVPAQRACLMGEPEVTA